jgi:phage terminase large subunit
MAAVVEEAKASLNPALRGFWLQKARNRVLIGGRSSSKSWDAAGFATFLSDNYKLRILCVRQFQNKIEESVYALLKIQIERFKLQDRFRVLESKIINSGTGSEFMFYGLWRHISEIKSLESVDILWIEEGHSLTDEQWKILEPTIRKEGSQVWIVFNPRLATDFAYKRFVVNPPPETVVRLINFDENPFLSNTMVKIIEAARLESEQNNDDEFEHIYLGVPRQDDDRVIMKRSWVMAAIDAHKKLEWDISGRKRIGFDVADDGGDKNATLYAHGPVALDLDSWKGGEDELLKSCSRTFAWARKYGADITYDSIGVGASAGAKFNELNVALTDTRRVGYQKFNAGGAVWRPDSIYEHQTKNKDHFLNIKAQAWWLVADRFRNTYNAVKHGAKYEVSEMISISSELPMLTKLIDELCTPKRDFDTGGKVKVESKKDLANPKREGGPMPSPNLADAFIMAFAPGNAPLNVSSTLLESM